MATVQTNYHPPCRSLGAELHNLILGLAVQHHLSAAPSSLFLCIRCDWRSRCLASMVHTGQCCSPSAAACLSSTIQPTNQNARRVSRDSAPSFQSHARTTAPRPSPSPSPSPRRRCAKTSRRATLSRKSSVWQTRREEVGLRALSSCCRAVHYCTSANKTNQNTGTASGTSRDT